MRFPVKATPVGNTQVQNFSRKLQPHKSASHIDVKFLRVEQPGSKSCSHIDQFARDPPDITISPAITFSRPRPPEAIAKPRPSPIIIFNDEPVELLTSPDNSASFPDDAEEFYRSAMGTESVSTPGLSHRSSSSSILNEQPPTPTDEWPDLSSSSFLPTVKLSPRAKRLLDEILRGAEKHERAILLKYVPKILQLADPDGMYDDYEWSGYRMSMLSMFRGRTIVDYASSECLNELCAATRADPQTEQPIERTSKEQGRNFVSHSHTSSAERSLFTEPVRPPSPARPLRRTKLPPGSKSLRELCRLASRNSLRARNSLKAVYDRQLKAYLDGAIPSSAFNIAEVDEGAV